MFFSHISIQLMILFRAYRYLISKLIHVYTFMSNLIVIISLFGLNGIGFAISPEVEKNAIFFNTE